MNTLGEPGARSTFEQEYRDRPWELRLLPLEPLFDPLPTIASLRS